MPTFTVSSGAALSFLTISLEIFPPGTVRF
jgi:hypothetical protein